MLEDIKQAQKSIYLEMYIFADNTINYDFFGALKQKAKQGLKVKIIIDSFGSFNLPTDSINQLSESGIEILFFNHWLRRTHRKILIVDDHIVFLGGVNIHKKFKTWTDLQIRIEKARAVKSALTSFSHAYRLCGGKDAEILTWEKKTLLGKTRLWIAEHWHGNSFRFRGKISLKKYYKNRIENAKTEIIMATPYFVPRRWLATALKRAVYRGVKVSIIIPKQSDQWKADRANYFYMSRLSKCGVKFYLYPTMNHAKAMVLNNEEGMIGSQNLDFLSFSINAEIGMFFQKPDMVKQLSKILNDWKNESTLFTPESHPPKWLDYLLSPIFKLFHRVL